MTDLAQLRAAAVRALVDLGPDADVTAGSDATRAVLAFADAVDDAAARTWRGLLRDPDAAVPADTLLAWIRPREEPLTRDELVALRKKRRAPRAPITRRVFAAKVNGATSNRKLGPQVVGRHIGGRDGWTPTAPYVMTTTAPIAQSCPRSCPFFAKAKGSAMRPCYADTGFTRFGVQRLERLAERMTPEQVAVEEAMALDSVFADGIPQDGARGGRDLRVHVAGDCRTEAAARILADAITRWKRRGGGSAWTYTHAWRDVPRAAWGPDIAVHASCETMQEVADAHRRGYGAVLVVERHDGPHATKRDGFRILPCVAETHDDATCASCRICLDPERLHRQRLVVAFEAHGGGAKEVRRRIRLKTIP